MPADLTYEDWTQLLGEFFFGSAHQGDEILFAVDETSLAEASGLSEDEATASLAACVRSVIGNDWDLFQIKKRISRWERNGKDPDHPALPLLALTVLAASRMGSIEGYASHNFYVPLRRSLNQTDPGDDVPGSYLTYVKQFWESLADWTVQDLGGGRGTLTVRNPGRHYGRGYATQHALVKSSDLHHLDAFFRRIGLQPGERPAPGELLRAFRVWVSGRQEPWALRLQRVSADEELADYAQALLAREAARWDGQPRDPRTGRTVGRLRVGFASFKRPDLGLYVEYNDRLPSTVSIDSGLPQPVVLERSDGWYSPHPIEGIDIGVALQSGAEIRGGSHRFVLRAEPALAVTYDDDLGCWVSVDSISFGVRYHLLIRADFKEEVIRFAGQCSTEETRIDAAASRQLPAGWLLALDFRIDARPTIAPPPSLESLIPVGAGPRLRLVGGLPLSAGSGVYLKGGEPSLALSTICDDDLLVITKESTGQRQRFRVHALASREVPLSVLCLEPDSYLLQHGESAVRLQIIDGIADEAGPGAGRVGLTGRDGTRVVGTLVDGRDQPLEPLVLPLPREGGPAVLIGPSPSDVLRVSTPSWLASIVGFDPSWRRIDAWPKFRPVWLLMRGPSGGLEASLLSAQEPAGEDPSATTQWARFLGLASLFLPQEESVIELWGRYRAAAGVQRG